MLGVRGVDVVGAYRKLYLAAKGGVMVGGTKEEQAALARKREREAEEE